MPVGPNDELAIKRERIRGLLDERGLDGVLLATPPGVSWITCGGDPVVDLSAAQGVAAVLCQRGQETLLTNTIERARLVEEALPRPPQHVEVFDWYATNPFEVVQRLLPGSRLGCDLAIAGFEDCSTATQGLRLSLTVHEEERYRALGRDAGLAIEETAQTIEPGLAEIEIAGALAAETYDRGATPIVVLVAVDDRVARYRHPLPTAKRLERYGLLVLCARRHGLVASVTRSVHFGPVPGDLARRQEACARVDAAFLAATRPDSSGAAAFAAGMAAYAAEGYPDEWKLHHQGGAAGYLSREWLGTPTSHEAILEHMAFAWNPSITGVKTEDTVLLSSSGLETLTATGEWPTIEAAAGGTIFRRPAILAR